MKDFIVRDRSADVTGKVIFSVRIVRDGRCVSSLCFSSLLEQMRCSCNAHRATGLHVFSIVSRSIVYPRYPALDNAVIVFG